MSRLPALGPRGEGWFALQIILFAAIGLAALVAPGTAGQLPWLGLPLLIAGGLLVLTASLSLGPSLSPLPRPTGAEMVTSGLYGVVRHPIYVGVLGIALGLAILRASVLSLALSIVLAVFFDLKARREEAWLRERYPGYAEYARRTRRFIPGVY